MKGTGRSTRKSLFWSRLLGLLIAFAIIAVLGFGGVKNLMGELSAVYDALTESQSELAVTQHELASTQAELANAKSDLSTAEEILAGQSSALAQLRHLNADKGRLIEALVNEQWVLKNALGEAARELAHSHQQLQARDSALRAAVAELERQRQQPKLSVVVTTERMLHTHYRERFAASHVQFLASSDEGTLFFDGKTVEHEVEESAVYGERTQVVITQTAPGHDVLDCLNDASKNCARIIEARVSQRQLAYAYQAQFSGMEMSWLAASG
ncbi:MAG: hypothetical protein OXG78_12580 [Chloroflexi bacterium]|nr:hypothetical protein [Chloroflexota bacterium]